MKNNLRYYFFAAFIFLFFKNIVFANEFTFNVAEIDVLGNGNIINAKDGTAITKEGNIKFDAEKFVYDKTSSILNATNGVVILTDKNIIIKANKFTYNRDQYLINAVGDVTVKDLAKDFSIKSENIFYNDVKQIITSNTITTIEDSIGNIILSDNIIYTLNDGLVKLNKAKITGIEKDIIQLDKAYINLFSKKLIGKDVSIDFNQKLESENEPRLKGSTISHNSKQSIIKNGVFTTCKKNDDCPPWQFLAKEIRHDKVKKTINYKNAWLKIYDKPVFYFPKFFHPDPTVKRQSGFLMPSFQDSRSLGGSFNLPYYHVLSDNKDLTISPRFYSNEKILTQSEYRQKNMTYEHLLDFSIVNEKNQSTKSHFFLNSNKKLDSSYFEESELSIQLEQVTNDTYLKTYKLKSPIIKDYGSLKSSLRFDAYKEGLSLNMDMSVYEDLSKKKNDRYEYILPSYNLVKDYGQSEKFSGNLSLSSLGYLKSYNTNTLEKVIINDFLFNSSSLVTNKGLKNNYNLLVKNVNTDGQKSSKYKEGLSHELATIIEYNSSYPLKKEMNNYSNILEPIVSFRYSPNDTKDMKDNDRRIDVNNIFGINRIGVNDSVEGGSSLTYGVNFTRSNILNEEMLNIKLANVSRNKEEKNLPSNSSLGQKTSDIFGSLSLSPSKIWSIGYEFAEDQNLSKVNYELLKGQININKFTTKFEYLNENNTTAKETYLSNVTSYQIDKSNNIAFETRENKKTKITEFYNLVYQYRNDCLVAALDYSKEYYTDRDLKPDENIFIKLTIIPFGQTSSPNLKR